MKNITWSWDEPNLDEDKHEDEIDFPECLAEDELQSEIEMQAFDEQLDPDGLGEQGQAAWDEYERLESSAGRWQESQADQDYWQQHQAPWQDHSPTCNCLSCCGEEF